MPQDSMLDPHLINILLNDLFFFVKDNTIHAARNNIEELIKVLQTESKSVIGQFKVNDMIVNPDKFQAMIMSCDKEKKTIMI